MTYRTSALFKLWAKLYEFCWGGVKRMILPNKASVYRILRGPGRGIRFLTNPVSGGTRILLGLYEPDLMRWLSKVVKPGSVVYDIGSFDGHEALIAAKLAGPNGLVFAFEPDESARRQLQANLDFNPELAKRIRIEPFLVGNRHDPAHGIVSIDGFYQKSDRPIPPPDIVKMDVEGAECEVLEGMEELATRHCPQTFIECHLGPHIEETVRNFFSRHNIPTERSSSSFFEVSRQGYNAWIWTTMNDFIVGGTAADIIINGE